MKTTPPTVGLEARDPTQSMIPLIERLLRTEVCGPQLFREFGHLMHTVLIIIAPTLQSDLCH